MHATSSTATPAPDSASWQVRAAAYFLALVFAGALVYDVLRMPVQLFDSLELILAAARSSSIWTSFSGGLGAEGYLRPLHPAQVKALFEVADGNYWLAYRGFHAALVAAAVLLFVRALRMRTVADLCAGVFALTVMTGLHTFPGIVKEAYPVSHYLEIPVACLLVLNLAQARPRLMVDVAAVITFVAAVLSLESGVLVWVVAVAAWLSGLKGISGRGLVTMTALLGAYLFLRFQLLSVGVPGLDERSSGYLLARLDPAELDARFGDRVIWFYAYNVLTSIASPLFSEPQSGVFAAAAAWLAGDIPPRIAIGLLSSVLTTAAIAWATWDYARDRGGRSESGRLLVIFPPVLAANAALSFAYTKDEIMSIAGVFYALAAYAAVARVAATGRPSRRATAIVLTALLVASPAWAVRSLGIHHLMRSQAFKQRNDWGQMPWTWQRNGLWPSDPELQRLILDLKESALDTRPPNPAFTPRWANRIWGD